MLLADIGPQVSNLLYAIAALIVLEVLKFLKDIFDKRDLNKKLEAVPKIAENVQILEKSMNSMKDAQVDLSKKLGAAEGEAKGRADQRAETRAEGKLEPAESVTQIIDHYKAGELKQDVADLKQDVAETPKKVVAEIEKEK